MTTRTLPLLALFAATAAAGPALAQGMSYGRAPKIEADPSLPGRSAVEDKTGTKIPLDLTFHDHLNQPVRLRDVTGGKPTVLILAYYSCPKLCTEVLNGLVGELRKMARDGYVVGRDFHVVTVSINPMDAPAFAFKKRRSYLDELDRRPDDEPGWSFLTAGHGQGTNVAEAYRTIQTLADAVGFRYVADNQRQYDEVGTFPEAQREAKLDKAVHKTKDFIHPSTVMVVTPDGTVSRYFQGLAPASYTAKDLRFALVEAGDGKTGTFVDQMALNCFAYDQNSGTYKPVMGALALAAAPFPLLIGVIIYFAWRRSKRERSAPPAAVAQPSGDR